MSRPPVIANPRACLIVGLLLFTLGALCLHDAYEGRGRKAPLILRPFTFW